jgi:hypothetical protein
MVITLSAWAVVEEPIGITDRLDIASDWIAPAAFLYNSGGGGGNCDALTPIDAGAVVFND